MPYIYINHFVNNGIVYMTNFGNDLKMDDTTVNNLIETTTEILNPIENNETQHVNQQMNDINEITQLDNMNELTPIHPIDNDIPDELNEEELLELLQRAAIGTNLDDTETIENEIETLKRKIDIFNANISLYDDLIKEEELKRVIGIGMEEGWIDSLKSWIGYDNCKVIYDSQSNELTGDMIFLSLRLATTITFIIQTDEDDVFGSHHSIIPTKQNYPVSHDPYHFLFTLKNKSQTHHEQFKVLSQNHKLLDIFSGKDSWVLGVNNGYWINTKKDKCFISSNSANGELTEGYFDPKKLTGKIFTGSVYPKRFTIKRLIGLEFYPNEYD